MKSIDATVLAFVGALLSAAPAICDVANVDQQVTSSVEQRFAADPALKRASIEVVSKDGVVTLNGRVATAGARNKAFSEARHVSGVKSVVNDLRVVSR